MHFSKIVCLTFLLFGTISLIANAELVGYWSFDKADGVDDLTGNGHDGVIHGNPKVVAGKFGEALEFNGSTDYVEIPDAPAISELEALSMAAWIQPHHFGGAVDEVVFWNEAISVEDAMDPLPVKPRRKLTTTWGAIKALH